MSATSTTFPSLRTLSNIHEIVNHASVCSQKQQTINEARKLYLLSSFAEAKEGIVLAAKSISMIPVAALKLIPSTLYFLFSLGNIRDDEEGSLQQRLKIVHNTYPGITNVFFTGFKAAYCFSNIILSPLFGFIDPHFNTRCHKTLLEIKQKKVVERVEDKKIYFEDLAALDDVKAIINKSVLNILKNRKKADALGVQIQNILLHGLTGCGKTYLVEALVNSIRREIGKVTYHKIDSSTTASIYVNGSITNIKTKFDQIQKEINEGFFPILFMDEIDGMFSNRISNEVSGYYLSHNKEIDVLLQKVEALSGKALIIGATNRPSDLDTAFLRPGRIGKHIFVGPPCIEERKRLIQSYLNKYNQNILDKTINIDLISQKTENYSPADILGIFQEFGAELLELTLADLENNDKSVKRKSDQEILDELLAARKPSCSETQVFKYKMDNIGFFPKLKDLIPSSK